MKSRRHLKMKINLIDISKLESFNNHPFKVQDDLDMEELE